MRVTVTGAFNLRAIYPIDRSCDRPCARMFTELPLADSDLLSSHAASGTAPKGAGASWKGSQTDAEATSKQKGAEGSEGCSR